MLQETIKYKIRIIFACRKKGLGWIRVYYNLFKRAGVWNYD